MASRALLVARRGGALVPFAAPFAGLDIAGAFAVQAELLKEACNVEGEAHIGWKCGATGDAIQQRLGLPAPFFGPLFASDLLLAPALGFVEHADTGGAAHGGVGGTVVGVEAEFTLRIGKAIPLQRGASAEKLTPHVEAVVPSIEICSSRFAGGMVPLPEGTPALIADFAGHGALVLGEAMAMNPAALSAVDNAVVELTINGASVATGSAANVLGHPLESLAWLVNALAETTDHSEIPAGALIATGASCGQLPVAPGDAVVADFGDLGRVTLDFAGAAAE